MVGFRFKFTKRRGNAAGRTNPGRSPRQLLSNPLTKSRLTRLTAWLKKNLGRETEPPQNPRNVVVDLDSFFAGPQTPAPPSEHTPTPTPRTPVSTTWSEVQREWLLYDNHYWRENNQSLSSCIWASTLDNILTEPSPSERSGQVDDQVQREWVLYDNHFWRQHNQSQSTSSWTATPENSVVEPCPSGRSRQVDDSGDPGDLQAVNTIRQVSPDPVDLFFQLFWANEARNNPPQGVRTADHPPTQPTADPASPEPMGLFFQLFWANETTSHVNSTPELSEGSGSADTDSIIDFTEWMSTPNGDDHEANERFFGATTPVPATPLLRPSSPTDPFLSPSDASQGPAHLRDFRLPPPFKPLVRNTGPPVRPPRPPPHLCPPPM